ncbi:hypothetical protein [Pseudoprimorskyibacter insulae]|uniref:Uncharacterized protein n=1 Tax=Pseudoprimorskyibacter insulae TaxID=1695997 RepID=A0A2R8AUG4_9RHOB|nr:hypothetical protein [Pseudoprimorskyibacter insulae]SPF79675.1 hypothetical protein PRI8871_01472 [Pseudoprimorskyibacter insulae]
MLIKEIEVSDLSHNDAEIGVSHAIVAFLTEDSTIHIACKAANLFARSTEVMRSSLIRDAVRQLRRMPEFRAGHRDFRFAPGLV